MRKIPIQGDTSTAHTVLSEAITLGCKTLTIRLITPNHSLIFDKLGEPSILCVPLQGVLDTWLVKKVSQGERLHRYGHRSSEQIINILNQ